MLLKKPEAQTAILRDRKKAKITLFICGLIVVFFASRFLYIYQRSQSIQVAADSLSGVNIGVSSITNGDNPIKDVIDKITSYPHTLPDPGHVVGIAMGSQLTGLNDAELEEEVQGMKAMGVKWVRFDIEWGFVQYNSKDVYTWDRYDRIMNSLNKHGINGVAILTYTPEWARTPGCRGGAHCPPNDPKDFATFAAAAVNRYKNKGMHYWEIWNEPNSYDFWATKSDCVAYTNLLKATYPAIKKADPTAFVVTGGLAQVATTDVNIAPLPFIQCMYENGGKNYFDAVGYHPYTFPQLASSSNTNAWARMSKTNPSVRSIMEAYGDGAKKIWMTEYGVPTNGPDPAWYVSESKQSEMLTDAVNVYKTYDWAGPLFWYTYKDGGTEPTTNENFFGIIRKDNSQKPAYQTMKQILSQAL